MTDLTKIVSELITAAGVVAGGLALLWAAALVISKGWHKGRGQQKVHHHVDIHSDGPGVPVVGPLSQDMVEAIRRASKGGEF